ncbi:B3/B4 domain-containing protein [Caldinitratiruptor microaerophilus]|uniref:B3/B4 tRNA-binding domain-containing protein n=1 Tax=Caldinitratiruptor microaerophilus TaxID=671077 RepID=A0AA35GAF3_9FIRM|nr:phenylalanine--tRNA ligase beta subunit-related protein [Caldinitratiruptor microaerophilus]BDG61234.1 hypothetical protein caldi_23240 [Caldinitratiruptor microaerophilus]
MFFRLHPDVLRRFPGLYVGFVVVVGARNGASPDAARLLAEAVEVLRRELGEVSSVREHPRIAVWRGAMQEAGINPNRFPNSIEALASRVAKGGSPPSINAAVDLANAAALRHVVPVGCHDLGAMSGDLEVRPSRQGDVFTPMGAQEAEPVDPGEIVYADAAEVRTRRWIWRQGERAKATPASTWLFFPVDGLSPVSREAAERARDWLAEQAPRILGGRVHVGWVDRHRPEAPLPGDR